MSSLAKLLAEPGPPANSAKAANPASEFSNASKISRGVDRQTRFEKRRAAVLSRIEKAPASVRYCWLTDDRAYADFVVLVLAIRDIGTCELSIPRHRYDGFKLLEIIEDKSAQFSAEESGSQL